MAGTTFPESHLLITVAQQVSGCLFHKALAFSAPRPTASSFPAPARAEMHDLAAGPPFLAISNHLQQLSPQGSLGVSSVTAVTIPEELAENHFELRQYLSTHPKQEASPSPPTQGDFPVTIFFMIPHPSSPPANTSTPRLVGNVRAASTADSSLQKFAYDLLFSSHVPLLSFA